MVVSFSLTATAFDHCHKDLDTGDDAKMAVKTQTVVRIHGPLFPGLAASLSIQATFP